MGISHERKIRNGSDISEFQHHDTKSIPSQEDRQWEIVLSPSSWVISVESRNSPPKSCIDTPQQNGVAERKNRHLMEVACSLMLSTIVPKHF